MKLTFKQYLESKEQLHKAIANTPITIIEYEVCKYCSIAVGETKDDHQIVGLRPRQKIIVQWRYDNPDNPTPDYIKVIGPNLLEDYEEQQTYWSGQKLQKWLLRHTTEGQNHGNKI